MDDIFGWIKLIAVAVSVIAFILTWAGISAYVDRKIRAISRELHEREIEKLQNQMNDVLMTIYEERRFKK